MRQRRGAQEQERARQVWRPRKTQRRTLERQAGSVSVSLFLRRGRGPEGDLLEDRAAAKDARSSHDGVSWRQRVGESAAGLPVFRPDPAASSSATLGSYLTSLCFSFFSHNVGIM